MFVFCLLFKPNKAQFVVNANGGAIFIQSLNIPSMHPLEQTMADDVNCYGKEGKRPRKGKVHPAWIYS